jgi:hypothetical protein
VTDKRADIAILRTLGAAPSSIMAIFTSRARCIGILGTLIGRGHRRLCALNIESGRAGHRARARRPVPRQESSTTSASCRRQLQAGDVVAVAG